MFRRQHEHPLHDRRGLPIGYLVKNRGLAIIAYLAADGFLFTFQTLAVLLAWMAGEPGVGGQLAFGPAPTGFPIQFRESGFWAYGAVNVGIVLVGVGLTVLGNHLGAKRAAKRDVVTLNGRCPAGNGRCPAGWSPAGHRDRDSLKTSTITDG